MIIETLENLKQQFKDALQAINSKINPYKPNLAWDIISQGIASIFLNLYANLNQVLSFLFPQNAQGDRVDQWLYKNGLPARMGLSYGFIVVEFSTIISTAIIPVNTIFTDQKSGNTYQNLQEIDVTAITDNDVFTLYAVNPGNTIFEPINALLTNNSGDIVAVLSCNIGQTEETDQQAIYRILQAEQSPLSGARITDYAVFDIQANKLVPIGFAKVTDSIQIQNFVKVNGVGKLGNFILVGQQMTEYVLNQGLLPDTDFISYSREAPQDLIDIVTNYINSIRLAGLTIITNTSKTYLITNAFMKLIVEVTLLKGYSPTTPITIESQSENNQPIQITLSVTDLIKREIRRAICSQPYGGTRIMGQNYITLDSINDALNTTLLSNKGTLAQILVDVDVQGVQNNIHENILVPDYSSNAKYIQYIYDLYDYDSIDLTCFFQEI
jgi:hypothetical protein